MTEDVVMACSGLHPNGQYYTKLVMKTSFEMATALGTITIKGQKGKLKLRTIGEHTCIVFERIIK